MSTQGDANPWIEGAQPLGGAAGGGFLAQEETLDIGKYLHALRRRWKILLVCLLISSGYAVVRFSLTPKEYEAVTTLQIERKRLSTLALGNAGWMEDWWNMEYYPTQYRLLRSRGMAERVILHLGLHRDQGLTASEESPQETAGEETGTTDSQLANLATGFLGRLAVKPIEKTQLVELIYHSTSPEEAARIANAYAEVFIAWGNEDRSETVIKASEFLERQIGTLQEEIQDGQLRLNTFIGGSEFALDPAGEALVEQQRLLRKQRDGALSKRLNKEAEYRELVGLPKEIAVASTTKASAISELKGELFSLESEYEGKLGTFKPEWPEMVELNQEIETKHGQLNRLVDDAHREVVERASAELQRIRREEVALNDELKKLANDARLQNSDALQYNSITTYIDTRKELLGELLKRQSEVTSAVRTKEESNVRVVDKAIVPSSPFRPSLNRSLLVAILLGLGVGVMIIVLLEFLDRTIKTPGELESILGLPTLTIIPDISEGSGAGGYGYAYAYGGGKKSEKTQGNRTTAKGSRGNRTETPRIELLPHHSSRHGVSEAYRSLRTALLLSSADELKLVALTSAEPSEGKTATTANLAVVMAQLGRKVLIIDADLRRPRMHKIFRVSNRVGLVNFLTGPVDPKRLFFQTEVPNLMICPSGPIPPNPSELLSSERMRELLALVRSRFDFVLIDTPPALPVADAVILGPLMDGMVVCARAGVLTRDDAKLCRERLSYADLKIFGTVLNRYRNQHQRYGKDYNYYGGYETTETAVPRSTAA